MELYQTDSHYILLDSEFSLWCNRKTGELEPKRGSDLCSAWNPVCIGLCYGIVGKIKLHPEGDWTLLLIRQQTLVGEMAEKHKIYKINKISVLTLNSSDPPDLTLDFCKTHHFGIKKAEQISKPELLQKPLLKTWNSIKSAAENVKPKKREIKDKEKYEKRILEELLKMFNEEESFYYSDTYDLTSELQHQHSSSYNETLPLWKRCDDRFFWNKFLLQDLMDFKCDEAGLCDHWIKPVVQGYVQMEKCQMDFKENRSPGDSPDDYMNSSIAPLEYDIWLISRRSRHRAGTRSKRRGLDETGACANYVVTEQIIEFSPHLVSFVQVRGSIPVYWSQTGIKYRPPPRLDKGEEETHEAFKKHFEEQLDLYKEITIVTLAELSGKEAVLSDAFLSHVLEYNCENLTYVTFDFHEYCRGMKFENVSLLTEGIKDIIKDMRYCWVDNKGLICEQRGVFRVNCIDCLDRTNVVQTAIARIVMETQFRKLGLLPPEEMLPTSCRVTYQQLWANNGDTISKQYAGTAALKGDFTRTGERKLTGMMKDGVNSANRYYLRFRDDYRQAAIDLMLGQPVTLGLKVTDIDEVDDTSELIEKEENVKMLVEDCKKMLIVEPEQCLGGWSLINADPQSGDPDRQEMDVILLLTQRAVYVAWYDDESDQVNKYQKIFVEDIEKLEIGLESALFKSRFVCLRIHYHCLAEEGFFHTFRVPSSRLWNNVIIAVKNQEEAKESLRAIAQSFIASQEILDLNLEVIEKPKLDRKRTRPHPDIMDIHKQQQENSLASIPLPRDVSTDIPQTLDGATTTTSVKGQNEEEKTSPSRSPMDILQAIRSPFKKPSFPNLNNTAIKLNLTKSSITGINALNTAGRIAAKVSSVFTKGRTKEEELLDEDDGGLKVGQTTEVDAISRSSSDSTDDPLEVKATEDIDEEVMLGSCGILATSPSQLLLNTQLRQKEKRMLRQRVRSTSLERSQDETEEKTDRRSLPIKMDSTATSLQDFCTANQRTDDTVHSQGKGSGETNETVDNSTNHSPEIVEFSTEQKVETVLSSANQNPETVESSANQSLNSVDISTNRTREQELENENRNNNAIVMDTKLPHQEAAETSGKNIPLVTIETNEFCDSPSSSKVPLVKKTDQLHHPSMKISLSDTSLSLPSDSERKTTIIDPTSAFMKLKLRMSTLTSSTTSSATLKPPSVTRTRTGLKKSERLMTVFEQLVKSKLRDRENSTRFIFI